MFSTDMLGSPSATGLCEGRDLKKQLVPRIPGRKSWSGFLQKEAQLISSPIHYPVGHLTLQL